MKGYLQRLTRRARGDSEGLRPRVPLLFEPTLETMAAPSPEAAQLSPIAQQAPQPQPRATNEPLVTPTLRIEKTAIPVEHQSSASQPVRAQSPAPPAYDAPRFAEAVQSPHTASQRTAPIRPQRPDDDAAPHPPIARDPAPDTAGSAAQVHHRAAELQVDGTQPAPGPRTAPVAVPSEITPADRSGATPRPSFTTQGAIPRLGSSGPVPLHDRHDARRNAGPTPEPVVQVTIERLEVQAVAATGAPRKEKAPPRRDTLAEYLRRRQEATR